MAGRIEKTRYPGVYRVHQRSCANHADCKCPPSYQAAVNAFRDGQRKLVRKHFDTAKGARQWREDAGTQIRAGKFAVPTRTMLYEAATDLIDGMRAGRIPDRSGGRTSRRRSAGTTPTYGPTSCPRSVTGGCRASRGATCSRCSSGSRASH